MNTRPMLCFGHRGARGHEPENTLRSVRRALELGADGIEVDVHFTAGELLVIHDETLERTTDGKGRVAAQTFAYLRSLDAGQGERIPTLAEVCELVNRRAVINVELKGAGTAAPVAALIAGYVHGRGWSQENFLVSSFDHQQLETARSLLPDLRLGVLSLRPSRAVAEFAGRLGAWSLHPHLRQVTAKLVNDAHRRGLKVIVFTVNTAEEIARCRELGVDGVFSDFPERVAGRHPRPIAGSASTD